MLAGVLALAVLQGTAPSSPGANPNFDYHRSCQQQRRDSGCSHWEGLSCGEVDAILQNVRKYEKEAQHHTRGAPAASSPISLAPSSQPPAGADTGPRLPLRSAQVGNGVPSPSPRHAQPGREQYKRPSLQPLTETVPYSARSSPSRATGLVKSASMQNVRREAPIPRVQSASNVVGLQLPQAARRPGAKGSVGGRESLSVASGGAIKASSFPVVDTDGHTKYRLGDGLEPSPAFPRGRYKILRSLGSGTYGKVVECWDRQAMAYCAVKVVRAVAKYTKAAQLEISVFLQLQGQHGCVRLLRHFEYQGHICMSFELLGPNLYEIMRACSFRPFPLAHVRRIAAQVVESLCLVHGRAIVHTDVKPENILLVEQIHKKGLLLQDGGVALDQLKVKLVDFGSAVHRTWRHPSVVSTRHYRAPEIMMQLGWSFPADMWSMGVSCDPLSSSVSDDR